MIKYDMSRSEIEEAGKAGATRNNLAKILNSSYLYTDKNEESVGQWLANHGYWEAWVTSWMTKNIKSGFVCLDIGANYGYYTRVMQMLSGSSGEVHAFEANPEVSNLLNKSLSEHTDSKFAKANVYSVAISDKVGDVELSISSKYLGGSTIVFDSKLPSSIDNGLWDKKTTVPSTTIDLYEFDHIDLIKMDIEGAEPLAWKGMKKTLDRTDLVVLELGSYSPKEFIDDIFKNYNVWFINHEGGEEELTKEDIYKLDDLVMAVLRKKNA